MVVDAQVVIDPATAFENIAGDLVVLEEFGVRETAGDEASSHSQQECTDKESEPFESDGSRAREAAQASAPSRKRTTPVTAMRKSLRPSRKRRMLVEPYVRARYATGTSMTPSPNTAAGKRSSKSPKGSKSPKSARHATNRS